MRATMSVAPPGGYPTIQRNGRAGKFCARAGLPRAFCAAADSEPSAVARSRFRLETIAFPPGFRRLFFAAQARLRGHAGLTQGRCYDLSRLGTGRTAALSAT